MCGFVLIEHVSKLFIAVCFTHLGILAQRELEEYKECGVNSHDLK